MTSSWQDLPKILRPQLDRLAMRSAVGRVVPGVAVAVQGFRRCDAFARDEAFQRGEPVQIAGLAGIRIAGGLRAVAGLCGGLTRLAVTAPAIAGEPEPVLKYPATP